VALDAGHTSALILDSAMGPTVGLELFADLKRPAQATVTFQRIILRTKRAAEPRRVNSDDLAGQSEFEIRSGWTRVPQIKGQNGNWLVEIKLRQDSQDMKVELFPVAARVTIRRTPEPPLFVRQQPGEEAVLALTDSIVLQVPPERPPTAADLAGSTTRPIYVAIRSVFETALRDPEIFRSGRAALFDLGPANRAGLTVPEAIESADRSSGGFAAIIPVQDADIAKLDKGILRGRVTRDLAHLESRRAEPGPTRRLVVAAPDFRFSVDIEAALLRSGAQVHRNIWAGTRDPLTAARRRC
jgi:hypothetical protein